MLWGNLNHIPECPCHFFTLHWQGRWVPVSPIITCCCIFGWAIRVVWEAVCHYDVDVHVRGGWWLVMWLLANFTVGSFIFLLLCKSSSCIPDPRPWSDMTCKYFSHSKGLPCHFHDTVLWSMKVVHFGEVSTFSLVACALGNHCLTQSNGDLCLCFRLRVLLLFWFFKFYLQFYLLHLDLWPILS